MWFLDFIDGSLYGIVFDYSSVDFIFLSYMEWKYIEAVRRRIIFEKSQKL